MLERFLKVQDHLGPFSIDLFASRTNTQLELYCSWYLDPAARHRGVSLLWKNHCAYLFPPFALITPCLEKVHTEQTSVVLIAPVWQNQLWYSALLQSLADYSIVFPPVENILIGQEGQNHPLVMHSHLPLAAWPISGKPSDLRSFQRE